MWVCIYMCDCECAHLSCKISLSLSLTLSLSHPLLLFTGVHVPYYTLTKTLLLLTSWSLGLKSCGSHRKTVGLGQRETDCNRLTVAQIH